jgi:hypothetical protein
MESIHVTLPLLERKFDVMSPLDLGEEEREMSEGDPIG